MFKKLLTMFLSLVMILGMGTTVLVADASIGPKETITGDELIDQLNSIDFGKDVTFTVLPQSKLSDQEFLEFNSVENAEAYLREFIMESRKLATPSKFSMQNSIMQQITRIC